MLSLTHDNGASVRVKNDSSVDNKQKLKNNKSQCTQAAHPPLFCFFLEMFLIGGRNMPLSPDGPVDSATNNICSQSTASSCFCSFFIFIIFIFFYLSFPRKKYNGFSEEKKN